MWPRMYIGMRTRFGSIPTAISIDLVTAETELADAESGRIRFFPDGTSTGGTVTLRRGDRAFEVSVDWFDGLVELREANAQ